MSILYVFDNWKWLLENSERQYAACDFGSVMRVVSYKYRTEKVSILSTVSVTHKDIIHNVNSVENNPVTDISILFSISEAGLKKHPERGYLYAEDFLVFRYQLKSFLTDPNIKLICGLNHQNTYAFDIRQPTPDELQVHTEIFVQKWDEDTLVDFLLNEKLTKN